VTRRTDARDGGGRRCGIVEREACRGSKPFAVILLRAAFGVGPGTREARAPGGRLP
jgi:hypothetical protein